MITNLDTIYKNSTPKIGTPCTICYISDSYPAVVTEIVNKKTIIVQTLDHKLISGSPFGDSAQYEYFENSNNPKYTFTLRKNGKWIEKEMSTKHGTILSVGHARYRYDPHF